MATRLLSVGTNFSVRNIAQGSAAAAAGLQPHDVIIAVNGIEVPLPTREGFSDTEAFMDRLDQDFGQAVVSITVRRDGERRVVSFTPERGCASRFDARPAREWRATSDGRWVQVTTGLMAEANDDAALAAVLSHELAHNILGHRAARHERDARHAPARNVARRAAELEADRIGMTLLEFAGYPAGTMASFMRRLAAKRPMLSLGDSSHPGIAHRIRELESLPEEKSGD